MGVTYGFACTCCGVALAAAEDPAFDPETHFAAYVEPPVSLTCPHCQRISHTHWPIDPTTVRAATAAAAAGLDRTGEAPDYLLARQA